MDSDDDAPPPLSALEEQVEALKLRSAPPGETSGREESLPVASAIVVTSNPTGEGKAVQAAVPKLKKGFFDSKPKPRPKAPAAQTASTAKLKEEDAMPFLKGKKGGVGSGPQIPDFLRVEPDEQEKRYAAMKGELVDKLKPTPDMMSKVASDPTLITGFDDPEVMAAVSDVAANPQNISKYKNNPKVQQFYAAFGKLMGERLESMGGGAGGPQGPGQGSSGSELAQPKLAAVRR